jgi:hypothetical protein
VQRWRAVVDWGDMPHELAPALHLVAHTLGSLAVVCEPDAARWLWTHLRLAFADAFAVVLMPDHLHLVFDHPDAAAARRRLAQTLRHFTRRFSDTNRLWLTPPAAVVRTVLALRRTVRYVALNPCRARLVSDPLEWPWSTHRDVVGAVAQPWVTADGLADALRLPRHDFERAHHAYVSADPTAAVDGTPFPTAAARTTTPRASLADVVRAAVSATRATPLDVQRPGATRSLFIQLAFSQGWRDQSQLAEVCNTTTRTIRNHRQTSDQALLGAGLLCLGDRRLLQTDVPQGLGRAA